MEDDRLRLIFTCCHPALAQSAQMALTLRLLGGLTTPEIARAFLVSEPTMAQRISRAKAKIKGAGIPYRVPSGAELPHRLQAVLAVVYLVFNEGYAVTAGEKLGREDLCREAVRLGRVLLDLMPDEPEVMGLLALMLLVASRHSARTRSDGSLVVLREQDRTPVGRRHDRRRPSTRACVSPEKYAGALPGAGRHQRGPQRRNHGRDDGLAPDPGAVRPAWSSSIGRPSLPSTAPWRWPRSKDPGRP